MIKPPPPQENLDHEDRARRAQPPVLPGACAPRPQRRARLHVRSRLPPLVTAAHTQVRAAAALLAFINALAVSLLGLVPGTNVGYPAAVLGVIGILFTAAGMRSILASPATVHQQRRWQLGLIILLLLIFGVELACGVAVIVSPHRSEPVQLIGYALVSSLLVGIAGVGTRRWRRHGRHRLDCRA